MVLGLAAIAVVWKTRLWRLPDSPRTAGPEAPPVRLLVPQLLLIGFLLWVGQGLLGQLGMALFKNDPEAERSLRVMGLASAVGYAGVLVMIAGVCVAFSPWLTNQLGLAPTRWGLRDGVVGAALVIPVVAALGIASSWLWTSLQGTPPPEVAHKTLEKLAAGPWGSEGHDNQGIWWWLVVATVTLGAPLVEEIIYRGFLQSALAHAFGNRWLSIIVTSALFTIVHIGVADWRALPVLLCLGFGLGVTYERSGRLLAPILIHSVFNAANVATAVLQNSA